MVTRWPRSVSTTQSRVRGLWRLTWTMWQSVESAILATEADTPCAADTCQMSAPSRRPAEDVSLVVTVTARTRYDCTAQNHSHTGSRYRRLWLQRSRRRRSSSMRNERGLHGPRRRVRELYLHEELLRSHGRVELH